MTTPDRPGGPTHTEGQSARAQQVLAEMADLHPQGMAPAAIFNDPGIFALEREKVFARSWIYLAHESEIRDHGDYVLRYILDIPLIVVRGEEGAVHVMHNQCQHRGMQVCRSELGNAAHFRCPYHGWTYRNDGVLVGVPVEKLAYGDHLDKPSLGLRHLAQVDTYNGMVFGCLSADVEPLAQWLGDIAWYLDLFTTRSPVGLEVVGAPQRWVVDVDWKVAGENFIGDSYHTLMTHRSMVKLGQAPRDPKYGMLPLPGRGGHGPGVEAAVAVVLPAVLRHQRDLRAGRRRDLDPHRAQRRDVHRRHPPGELPDGHGPRGR